MHLGWDAPDDLDRRLKEKGLVQRERTPVPVMLFAVYLYLLGPSLQRVTEALEPVCPRTRKTVHNWVQRLGGFVREHVALVDDGVPSTLVVDETVLHIGSQYWTLWVALDPVTRAVYHVALSRYSTLEACQAFFDAIRERYGAVPARVVTDRAGWYKTILARHGIEHSVVRGGVRSYVERWHATLKDRSRSFDKYHPCRGGDCTRDHIRNWVWLVAFHYNRSRRHMSRGLSPPVDGDGSCWARFVEGVVDA